MKEEIFKTVSKILEKADKDSGKKSLSDIFKMTKEETIVHNCKRGYIIQKELDKLK